MKKFNNIELRIFNKKHEQKEFKQVAFVDYYSANNKLLVLVYVQSIDQFARIEFTLRKGDYFTIE